MKKTAISFMLVLAMVLAMVLVPAPAAEAAGENHNENHGTVADHCVCGATKVDDTWTGGAAGIGDHSCAAVTGWTAMPKKGNNLEAGNYYLTGDLTLVTRFLISSGEVTICLNGYDIIGNSTLDTMTSRRCFVVNGAATLNICDCQGGGEISSKTTEAAGSVLTCMTSDDLEVNLYSGTLVGSPVATKEGGTVHVEAGTCNLYNAVIRDGKIDNKTDNAQCFGGNVYVGQYTTTGTNPTTTTGTFNMYGGSIRNGSISGTGAGAVVSGGNVCVNKSGASFNMYGGSVIGGSIERRSSGKLNLKGGFVELGVSFPAASPYTINMSDNTYSDSLVIDLNGKQLAGTITTGKNKLYIVDSTAAVAGAGTGKLNATVNGTIAQGKALPEVAGELEGQRYVTIDGVAHRIYIGIENIQLSMNDDKDIGMSYTTNFQADAAVLAKLANTDANSEFKGCAFGYRFGQEALVQAYGFDEDGFKAKVTANIGNVLDSAKQWDDNSDSYFTKIWAQTFICLDLGGAEPVVIESNTYKLSLADVVQKMMAIDSNTEDGKELSAAAMEILTCIEEHYDYLFAC